MKDRPDEEDWVRVAQLAELGLLSASLIHELRQPLFALKASMQLARSTGRAPDVDDLSALLAEVESLEAVVENYSGFGRSSEPEVLYDLNDPTRRAVAMLEHRGRQVGAEVDVQLSQAALYVTGRPGAARQVVVNLLQNAYDAVSECPRRRVGVRTERTGATVLLSIRDSGPGVPAEFRNRLFEPFVTTKPVGHGTGLGLYIARRLVVEAHGELRLVFLDEGGLRVDVELPAAA